MKRIVIVCGLIAGLITTAWVIGYMTVNSGQATDMENGMWYGYASMLIAFSLIFVAIKKYRDNHNGGIISFGKAFRIGLYISLIASSMYVVVWLIDYFYILPEGYFEQHYTSQMIESLKASGASQAELDKKTAEMAEFSRLYKNPFFNALMTYIEILPVGLVVSLIAALILKRRKQKGEFQTAIA
jgi:hypothetical protein